MFKFFDLIVGYLTTLVHFVVNLFEMLIFIITAYIKSWEWLFLITSYLPAFMVAFIIVPLAIVLFFQFLNKGS